MGKEYKGKNSTKSKLYKSGKIIEMTPQVEKNMKSQFEKGRQQGMIQGLCIALSYSLRLGGNNVEEIWRFAGLSIQECIDNKVDEFDMEVLIPEFGTEEEKESWDKLKQQEK